MLPHKIQRAWLESERSGVVEFDRDWNELEAPSFLLGPGAPAVTSVAPAPGLVVGRSYGYLLKRPSRLMFVLPLEHGCALDVKRDHVYVAGDFNGWQHAVGRIEWEMVPAQLGGKPVLQSTAPPEKVMWPDRQRFKFVTGENLWLGLPDDAPNAVRDEAGNINRFIDHFRTGRHLWRFDLAEPLNLAESWTVTRAPEDQGIPLLPGGFFFELGTDLPLGAIPLGSETTFRLFAPRARSVTLLLTDDVARADEALRFPLVRRPGATGIWEVVLDQNLHCWYYWYMVDGVTDGPGRFEPAARVLDPYALAAVDRQGPGHHPGA